MKPEVGKTGWPPEKISIPWRKAIEATNWGTRELECVCVCERVPCATWPLGKPLPAQGFLKQRAAKGRPSDSSQRTPNNPQSLHRAWAHQDGFTPKRDWSGEIEARKSPAVWWETRSSMVCSWHSVDSRDSPLVSPYVHCHEHPLRAESMHKPNLNSWLQRGP